METAQSSYVRAVELLMEKYNCGSRVHRRKMAREAAGVLPNGTETKIVVSANVRAWRTMLQLRREGQSSRSADSR
jgi:thymidylate synthase (FAD)